MKERQPNQLEVLNERLNKTKNHLAKLERVSQ